MCRQSPTIDNCNRYEVLSTALSIALFKESAESELNIIRSGNLGKFYKHVNSRLHHKTGIAPIIDDCGVTYVTDFSKSEIFSQYFATIGVDDNGLFLPLSTPFPSVVSKSSDLESALNANVNDDEVSDTISLVYFDPVAISKITSCLNEGSAAGPDELPPFYLKNSPLS